MDLNKLRDEAYQIAKEHGWHDKEYSDSHWLMLLITEIAEAVQADRKGLYKNGKHFQSSMETEEEWRPVVGYENDYEVSNLGRVRSKDMEVWRGNGYYIKKGKILKPGKSGTGYYTCALRGKTKKVCKMVAKAFLFKSNKNDVVNHIDGNKLNDNVGNLEYISSSQNNKHAIVSGLRRPYSKISYEDMVDISFRMKYANESCASIYKSIKDRIPVTLNAIKIIKQRKRYVKYTDSVEFELADIVIRCLDLAGLRGFDLSEVTYIAEQYEDLKEGIGFVDVCYVLSGTATNHDHTREKIIAILAAVLRYCELTGIDLEWFIEQKMKYNRLRPYMHGDKKY